MEIQPPLVKQYFTPHSDYYDLQDFVTRGRTALQIASDRIQAKYGRPCGLALKPLQAIELKSTEYASLSQPKVRFLGFVE